MGKKKNAYSTSMKNKIKKRDNNECFFCHAKNDLTIAHIFVWRCDNGKPVEKNGMAICRCCHDKMDFGIGVTREEQIKMLRLCQMYLTLFYMQEIKDNDVIFNDKEKQYVKRLMK